MSGAALLAMVILLAANGFFVAAEFAFTAASRHRLEATPGRSARAAVRAIDELSFTLAGAQLGITIASLLLGAVAEPAVASIIESSVGSIVEIPEATLHTIALIVALLIVVFLHMVIGEMGPKNVAIADPERSSMLMALPFRAYATIFRPIIWLLNEAANLVMRAVGVDPSDAKEAHTADDLASLITAGRREGIVEDFAHRLLTGAIDVWDLRADNVMVPRTDVVALPVDATVGDVERTVVEHGYSRIPVYEETIDQVHGFVHAKDMLRLDEREVTGSVPSELIRPLLVVPESTGLGALLERMRRERSHLALVVDEHGGTAGIVTMEDIVEEVVGDIRDEHDPEAIGARRVAPGRFVLDASLRPSEVERACGVELPEGQYDTVGGLVMERLGRIAVVGDRVVEDAWVLRVVAMDGLRVDEVELTVRKAPS
jgi:CBS domain containing-hemolysin-like protein